MKPIAIVTPWFGKDLKGGAEQQAWQVAIRLAQQGHIVEVLTTCCRSFHDDWAVNHFKAGLAQEQNFKIRRFSVDCRDQHSFDRVNSIMLNLPSSKLRLGVNPVTSEEAAIFSSANINSTDLLSYLETQQEKYSAFIFVPYLYGPILNGLPIVASKAFLQPCLHNEVYAYLPQVANIFHAAKGLLFNSEGEAQLARQLYGLGIIPKSVIVGEGVEVSLCCNDAINQIGNFKVKQERFVFYLGRRDPTKNINLLLQSYALFKYKYPNSNLKLVLAGPGSTSFNDSGQGVVDLGLVEENEKEVLLTNCLALFQPSRNESYSRVIMEAWFYRRPVAVHRDCLATAIAVQRAKGGWLAGTETEWQELFSKIECIEENELATYGSNGQKYAEENAVWDKIIERYEAVLGLSKEKDRVNLITDSPRKKLKEIHQLLPNLAYGDAISNHALFIRDYLRSCGYKSDIFVRYLDQRVQEEAKVFHPSSISKQVGLIYHHSIGSEITAYAVDHPGPKCLIYHNITPAEFFQPYRPEFAKILETGRSELKQLAPHFTISVGDSAYNAADLAASGFAEPGVLPIAVDPQKWDMPADAALMAQLQDGKSNLLFVGRLAPNKCQDDLVEAFAYYLTLDQQARLILAGNGEPSDPYYCHLINTIERLNLTQHVLLTGQVDDTQLLALYRTAHLFWSMSEHEGFCVPLVEAMWFDIPILAYKSSVVPETLGEAGLMFTGKDDIIQVSALAKVLVKDQSVRAKVLNAQRKRRESFIQATVSDELNSLVLKMEEGDIGKVKHSIISKQFPLVTKLPLLDVIYKNIQPKMLSSQSNFGSSKPKTYILSEELSLEKIESIYFDVVLKQDFYGNNYGSDWHITPYNELAQIITHTLAPKHHLDVGCGKGLLVQAMRDLDEKSYGIDFSETLINQASKNIQQYLTVVSAENWLEKASLEKIDLITFTEVFEHLPVSILQQILNSLHKLYNKKLFLTIPSYGLDANFKFGIQVNNDNPSWHRDMMENIPFKNIVLEDGIPHHGHITLASYRWWTEFFLFHGYSRNRDMEVACVSNFQETIKRYNWHPYILEKTQGISQLTNSLETGASLGSGWHNYENFEGRWTDGLAKVYFVEANFRPSVVKITLSAPEINYIHEWNLLITLDNLIISNSLKFKWVTHFNSCFTEIAPRAEKVEFEIPIWKLPCDSVNNEMSSDCWRINIISPHFCPIEYGLSTDSRRLGVVIHSIKLL